MRRALLALASFALALDSRGEALRLCHPTATLDDLVRLTLVVDDPEVAPASPGIAVPDGLVVVSRDERRDTEYVSPYPGARDWSGSPARVAKTKLTVELLLRAAREGTFVIGPVEVPHLHDPPSRASAVTLRIVPNLELAGETYPAAMRALERAGRARVHFAAHAPKHCYVGEQVRIRWTLGTAEQLESVTILENPIVDEAVVPSALSEEFFPGREETEGMAFQAVREAVFYASAPGALQVGPMTIRAVGRSRGELRENESAMSGRTLEVVRTTPPFTIDVRPLPEGVSAAAVGELSLDCTDLTTKGEEWVATATVRGRASFFDDVKPQWESPLDFEASLTSGPLQTSPGSPWLTRQQVWTIRIPAVKQGRSVTIPPLHVDWFDPARGVAAKSSCWDTHTLRLLTARAPQAPRAPQPEPPPPPSPLSNWFRNAMSLLKPIVLLTAFAMLLIQLRRSSE